MTEDDKQPRMVWSCSLYKPPEEDETERLEEKLREQRHSFWEDAELLDRYLALTGLSQAACAKKLHRSQAAVANRLRLLKLSPELREKMRERSLTERHARALLRLEDPASRSEALEAIVRFGMNVAQTEAYVESRLKSDGTRETVPEPFRPLLAELEKLHAAAPDVLFDVAEIKGLICLTVQIPKKYDL